MTDKQLVEALREGNMVAFGELYRRYRDSLVRFAGLYVGTDDAEDLVQDVFLKLWSRRGTLPEMENPRSYLLRAVHNQSMNWLRDEKHRSEFRNQYARNIEIMAAEHADPDRNEVVRALYAKESLSAVERAIDRLPGRSRDIFRRSYLEGQSHKEIAARLRLSVSTVDNQIYNALKRLREQLLGLFTS